MDKFPIHEAREKIYLGYFACPLCSLQLPQANPKDFHGHLSPLQHVSQYASLWASSLGVSPLRSSNSTLSFRYMYGMNKLLHSKRQFHHPWDTVMWSLHILLHFTNSQSLLFKQSAPHMTKPWPFLEAMLTYTEFLKPYLCKFKDNCPEMPTAYYSGLIVASLLSHLDLLHHRDNSDWLIILPIYIMVIKKSRTSQCQEKERS